MSSEVSVYFLSPQSREESAVSASVLRAGIAWVIAGVSPTVVVILVREKLSTVAELHPPASNTILNEVVLPISI